MSDESAWEEVRALREQVLRLSKANDALAETVKWAKNTIHQAHHEGEPLGCPRGFCVSLERALISEPPTDFTNRIRKENAADE